MTIHEQLASSLGLLAQASEARDNICAAIDQQNSAADIAHAAAQELERAQDRELVESVLALGHSVKNEDVDDQIAALRRTGRAHQKAHDLLETKLRDAKIKYQKAAAQVRDATQAIVLQEGLEPARERLAVAGDAFFAELVAVAAWHRAAYLTHGDPNKSIVQISGVYGPAMEFASQLTAIDWVAYPYSIKPKWLNSVHFNRQSASGLTEADVFVEASIAKLVSP